MVSDIGMPHSDGYELITKIRTAAGVRGLHLPAIALTAYSREEDRRRAIEAGFQAYVAKPVEPDNLVDHRGPACQPTRRRTPTAPAVVAARVDLFQKFARTLERQRRARSAPVPEQPDVASVHGSLSI